MVPMHAQERKEAFHEPTHPQPLPGGEQASVRVLSVPLLGGARGGFMVPMHAQERKEALHEPRAKAGASSRTPYALAWCLARDSVRRGAFGVRPACRRLFILSAAGIFYSLSHAYNLDHGRGGTDRKLHAPNLGAFRAGLERHRPGARSTR